jgi:hypothetical protein
MAYSPSRSSYKWNKSVATTDATVTTIISIPIVLNSASRFLVSVVGKRTGGSSGSTGDIGSYLCTFTANNVSGTTTNSNLVMIDAYESQPAWDVTITTSAGNALIQVTGAANNNITWNANILDTTVI